MLLADFNVHPLWDTSTRVKQLLSEVETSESNNDWDAIHSVAERIEHFRAISNQVARFFEKEMLDEVASTWADVREILETEVASPDADGMFLASVYAGIALEDLSEWPTVGALPFENTEAKAMLKLLKEKQAQLEQALTRATASIEDRSKMIPFELEKLATARFDIEGSLNGQKQRIDEVVSDGLKKINDLTRLNAETYSVWQLEQESAFKEAFAPFQTEIEARSVIAQEQLTELSVAVDEYKNLSTAAAAETLARNYEREAKSSRIWGGILYAFGLALIVLGAVPLLATVFPIGAAQTAETSTDISWTQVALRLGVGVLAASAATVAIRLGSRLISEAGSVMRMALELRTIGPFLASVTDRENVDGVRLELIDRTFGRSYVPLGMPREKEEEVINVTAVSQLLAAVGKMMSRTG